jgi:hypothetical protein
MSASVAGWMSRPEHEEEVRDEREYGAGEGAHQAGRRNPDRQQEAGARGQGRQPVRLTKAESKADKMIDTAADAVKHAVATAKAARRRKYRMERRTPPQPGQLAEGTRRPRE